MFGFCFGFVEGESLRFLCLANPLDRCRWNLIPVEKLIATLVVIGILF